MEMRVFLDATRGIVPRQRDGTANPVLLEPTASYSMHIFLAYARYQQRALNRKLRGLNDNSTSSYSRNHRHHPAMIFRRKEE